MKKLVIVVIILVLVGVIWWANRPVPNTDIPNAIVTDVTSVNEAPSEVKADATNTNKVGMMVDNANVKVSFKGFGPDKSHVGSFGTINSNLVFTDNKLTGSIEVDMNTLQAPDSEKLQNHLKSADFFDVAVYPKATFKITSMANDTVTGTMNIHGVIKNVTLPVKKDGMQYVSNFNINMKDFGIVQKFANEVVELTVTVPVK